MLPDVGQPRARAALQKVANAVGATTLISLMFDGRMFESRQRSRIRERLEAVANVARQRPS
jgi:hypothetical protein